MKHNITLILLITFISAKDTKWGVPEDQDIAILTTQSFDEFIKQHPLVMVKFYAPWCGHCKSMAPAYESLARRMKEKNLPVAKVDLTVETELASRYNVQGYPTLVLFMAGEQVTYKGERTEDAMYKFLASKVDIDIPEIKNENELNLEMDKNISGVYFVPEGDKDVKKTLQILKAMFDDIPLSYSYDVNLKDMYDLNNFVFVLFRNFDDGKKMMVANQIATVDNLKRFIGIMRYPIVIDFDEKAAQRIFSAKQPTMVFFSDNDSSEQLEAFRSFAKGNNREVLYTYAKISDGFGSKLAEFLGVTSKDDPATRLFDFSNNGFNKYKISEPTTFELKLTLTAYKEGKLRPYYKSEPLPNSNDQPVKIAVGDNFDDLVINNDKFVLVEVYAPWCGHCKQFEPIYNQLGELLKNESDIVIAKIDGTTNEHKTIKLKSFPTIYFYRPGSKDQPINYEGNKDVDSFLKFLEEKLDRKFDVNRSTIEEL